MRLRICIPESTPKLPPRCRLDGKRRVVEEPDPVRWAEFLAAYRHVAYSKVSVGGRTVSLHTAFLGCGYIPQGRGDRAYFSTVVWGVPHAISWHRYHKTWAEAVRGHDRTVAEVARYLQTVSQGGLT